MDNTPIHAIVHVKAARSILTIIAVGVMVIGALLAGMGIALVYLGPAGTTKMHFFGQSFDSTNVGIAAIFLGATTIVVVLLRLMKRLLQLSALPKD